MSDVSLKEKTPAERRDFLLYYAGVMEREVAARPGQNCEWMEKAAERSRREAAAIDLTPAQGDLFGGMQ